MELKVTCGVCNAELLKVDKPTITQDDINMYQQNTLCDTDGSANIIVQVN